MLILQIFSSECITDTCMAYLPEEEEIVPDEYIGELLNLGIFCFKLKKQLVTNFKSVYSFDKNVYHHLGIYCYQIETLKNFVSLDQSQNEINNKLEQLRALENSMSIHVGYINSSPLSVDTKNDLTEVRKIMEKSN